MFCYHFPQSLVLSLLCLNSHVLRDVIRVVFWWDNRRHCLSEKNNLPFQSIFCLLHAFQKKFQALLSFSWAKWQRTQRRSLWNLGFAWHFRHCFSGEWIGNTLKCQWYHFCRSWVGCMLSKRISSIGIFIVSEMTENPTAKYEKFWFPASLLINCGFESVVLRCS